jgi:hypothetical protein
MGRKEAFLFWGLGGVAPLPFDTFGFSETRKERHATQVRIRQSLTFALCVNRLLLW